MFSFRRWSISRKILLGILPLFLLFISLSVAINNRFQEQEMMEQAQLTAHTYGEIIKEALVSMMVNNLEVDESFLDRAGALTPFDSLHILVSDLHLRKEVLTGKNLQRGETRRKTLQPHDDVERTVLLTGTPQFGKEGDRFRGVIPFQATEVCQKCHAVPVGYTLGAVDLQISFSQISQVARENWKRSFIIFLGFSLVAVMFASALFARFVSRPVDRLVKATTAISKGNLENAVLRDARETEQSNDELTFLSLKFDAMRESLKEKIEQLDDANKNLADRNTEVEQALARLKQAQEDLVRSERLAVTGKMTAQLSHEINNPIHNIHSLLESSLRKIDGQPRELVSLALEEVNRMAKLTRQMLDFYRGSVVEYEKGPVNLPQLLEHLLRENQETFVTNGIQFVMSVAPSATFVLGSQDKLKQVFLNLILNARDAMPNGGTISIVSNATNGRVQIQVSDSGIGISAENLGRIFDAFFTTKKEVSGVGLGLSVTYGIVQQHNGTIRVSSTEGKGTTFTIELPAVRENHA